METLTSKLVLVAVVAALLGVQTAQAESRKDKVQRDTRNGAVGGWFAATWLVGPAAAKDGAVIGAWTAGTISRVAHSGEARRAKKDLKRHAENVTKFAKKHFKF